MIIKNLLSGDRLLVALFMHRLSSRRAAGAAMPRRATKGPAGVLVQYGEEPKAAQHSQCG